MMDSRPGKDARPLSDKLIPEGDASVAGFAGERSDGRCENWARGARGRLAGGNRSATTQH